jgi:serine/threonine-protein kinase RsbW
MLARARVVAPVPGGEVVARLTLSAIIDERPRAIAFIVEACCEAGVPIDYQHSIVSAVGEAYNNIVLHSYRGNGGLIDLEIERHRDRFVVRLRDTGEGFDPRRLKAPDLDALPEGGMGVFIILRAMDEVSWYKEGVENVVTMVKRLPRRR